MGYLDDAEDLSSGKSFYALTPAGLVPMRVGRNGRPMATGRPVKVPNLPTMESRSRANQAPTKAQFDIAIKRLTHNLAFDLEVPIFGASDLESGYQRGLNIPAGVTMTILGGLSGGVPSLYGKYRFRFSDGVNTDDIDVTCQQYPYPSLVKATLTNLFQARKLKYFISDKSKLEQYSQRFDYLDRSMFGKKIEDGVPVLANQNATDFRDNIIEIPVNFGIDQEKFFALGMIQETNFVTTLSFFVDRYDKRNIGDL